jgi:hypothetical protein
VNKQVKAGVEAVHEQAEPGAERDRAGAGVNCLLTIGIEVVDELVPREDGSW